MKRLSIVVVLGVALSAMLMGAEQQPAASPPGVAPSAAPPNPFKNDANAIKEGRALYQKYNCSGCHGLGGGGGMAVALIDDAWKFGSDDRTLFKLIKGEIPQSTMPKTFGSIPDEEIWKMLAYIRSLYSGDRRKVDW